MQPSLNKKSFLDWVEQDYDRLKVKQEFLDGFGKGLEIDKILGRE